MRRYENDKFNLGFERRNEWVKFVSNGMGFVCVDSSGAPTLTRSNTEQLIEWLRERLNEMPDAPCQRPSESD